MENNLPVDLFHWILAFLPLLALLVLLVGVRWKAHEAGVIGLFIAWIVALLVFDTPFRTLAVANTRGIWDAIFILYVVWPALLLYQIADKAGGFNALRIGIRRFSRNHLFLVLAFGWIFASFLQGIAGFGTPIAVAAPLLLAIGVRPIYAVVIPLIGHAWANMFGTLAVGWLATIRVVDLENLTETAFQTGILLWIPNILAGFALAWLYGRMKGIARAWPLIIIISLIQGGGQLALVLVDPVLSTFIAATVALAALYPLSRWKRYQEEGEIDSPVMEKQEEEREEQKPVMGLSMSLLPYGVLAVAAIIGSAIPPVESFLSGLEVGVPFPETTTGYNVIVEAEDPYSPFSPLTHPGTYLLIASLVAWLVYRAKGYFRKAEEQEGKEQGIWKGLVSTAVTASVAVTAFLGMSKVMDNTGQTGVLALGISEIAPPVVYAFFSNWIGILGAFMTSSNTASNILFAPLQQTVAQAEQLSEATIIAAQSTGGAIGNAIAPANIVLGLSTIQKLGNTARVLRKTLIWAALAAVATGALTLLLDGITFVGG